MVGSLLIISRCPETAADVIIGNVPQALFELAKGRQALYTGLGRDESIEAVVQTTEG